MSFTLFFSFSSTRVSIVVGPRHRRWFALGASTTFPVLLSLSSCSVVALALPPCLVPHITTLGILAVVVAVVAVVVIPHSLLLLLLLLPALLSGYVRTSVVNVSDTPPSSALGESEGR